MVGLKISGRRQERFYELGSCQEPVVTVANLGQICYSEVIDEALTFGRENSGDYLEVISKVLDEELKNSEWEKYAVRQAIEGRHIQFELGNVLRECDQVDNMLKGREVAYVKELARELSGLGGGWI